MKSQLHNGMELFVGLFNSAPDAIVVTNSEGVIVQANAQAEATFGYTRQELLGQNIEILLPPSIRTKHVSHRAGYLAQPKTRLMGSGRDLSARRKDGSLLPVDISLSPCPLDGKILVISIIRDIAERRQTEAKLRHYVRQLRALANQMVKVKEAEARRIARELHDETGQLLAAVHIGLQRLRREIPVQSHETVAELTQHLTLIEERLRSVAHELRPPALDQLGLHAAIESLARRIAERHRFTVSVQGLRETRLPPAVETALYRIVQESLNNVGKHAGASSVQIRIEKDQGSIRCSIKDDGAGFDAAHLWSSSESDGIGLIGIRERLQELDGSLRIISAPGGGTELIATIPEIRQETDQIGNKRQKRRKAVK